MDMTHLQVTLAASVRLFAKLFRDWRNIIANQEKFTNTPLP